jgi:hypothetical protein
MQAYLVLVFPDLGMLSAEHLRVKEAVALSRDGLHVGLATEFDALAAGEGDVLWGEGVVERVKVEGRVEAGAALRCGGLGTEHGGKGRRAEKIFYKRGVVVSDVRVVVVSADGGRTGEDGWSVRGV